MLGYFVCVICRVKAESAKKTNWFRLSFAKYLALKCKKNNIPCFEVLGNLISSFSNLLKQEASRDKARHAIEMFKADLEAYDLYDKVSLLSLKQLAVDEAIVNIEKTIVKNEANLRDANSTITTTQISQFFPNLPSCIRQHLCIEPRQTPKRTMINIFPQQSFNSS